MYAVAGAARPGLLLRAGPGDVPRDGGGRDHRGRGVPLPAPPARRHAVRRPERDGPRAARGRATRPGIRITLLDTCYLAAGFGAAARGRAGALSDGDAGRAGPTRRRGVVRATARGRGGHPLGARRAARPAAGRRRGRRTGAAARAPLRAGRRERRLPRGVRRDPDRSCSPRPARSGRAPPPCTPPTSPTTTSRLLGERRHQRLLLPDHRARPRRRHRPAPRAARRRRRAHARLRQPRGDRPVRGDARASSSTSGSPPRSAATGRPPSCSPPATADGHALARLRRRRPDRGRRARRPGHPRHRQRRAPPAPAPTRTPPSSPPPAPTSCTCSRDGGRRHPATRARSAPSSTGVIRRLWQRMTHRRAHRHRRAGHQRTDDRRSACSHDAALVVEARPGRLGRARRARRPPPTTASTSAAAP